MGPGLRRDDVCVEGDAITIDDYAAWAATIAKVTSAPDAAKLSCLGLGLAADPGEVADHIKKLLRDGKLEHTALIGELGDVIYCWTCLCVAAGQQPSDCWRRAGRRLRREWAQLNPSPSSGERP
jgi:hypothetical protein